MSGVKSKVTIFFLVAIFAASVFGGCATEKQARDVKTSGFLGDYSMLSEGKEGQALLTYRNPEVNWASYNKILLDPVTIWRRGKDPMKGIPQEDLVRLANNFYYKLNIQLSDEYEMVKTAGPNTLHIQVALTDVEDSSAALDTVTGIVPVGIVISLTKDFATGKPAFVGEASVEGKITDAQTGELLLAAVDRRVGGKTLEGATDSWDDVHEILKMWSKMLKYRLCTLRGGEKCVDPNK